jgi:hypothetical protein
MAQVASSGTVSSQNQPPAMIPTGASSNAARLHSKVSGSREVSEEGGSYMVWNRPRPNTPE